MANNFFFIWNFIASVKEICSCCLSSKLRLFPYGALLNKINHLFHVSVAFLSNALINTDVDFLS